MKNGTEVICEWPNGSLKKVVLIEAKESNATIIWNERHPYIEGQGRIVGMTDSVPISWLFTPYEKQERTVKDFLTDEASEMTQWILESEDNEPAIEMDDSTIKESSIVEEWRHRTDADDLDDGVVVLGLLKHGETCFVHLNGGHWHYDHSGQKCFELSMWRHLPPPPCGWTPLVNENGKAQIREEENL